MNDEDKMEYYGLNDEETNNSVLDEGKILLAQATNVMEERGATKETLKVFETTPNTINECQSKLLLASEVLEKLQPNEASTIIDVNNNVSNESMGLIKTSAEDFIKKIEGIANNAEVSSTSDLESVKNSKEIIAMVNKFYADYDTVGFDIASKRDPEAFKRFIDLVNSEHTIDDIKNITISGGMRLSEPAFNVKFNRLAEIIGVKTRK